MTQCRFSKDFESSQCSRGTCKNTFIHYTHVYYIPKFSFCEYAHTHVCTHTRRKRVGKSCRGGFNSMCWREERMTSEWVTSTDTLTHQVKWRTDCRTSCSRTTSSVRVFGELLYIVSSTLVIIRSRILDILWTGRR